MQARRMLLGTLVRAFLTSSPRIVRSDPENKETEEMGLTHVNNAVKSSN